MFRIHIHRNSKYDKDKKYNIFAPNNMKPDGIWYGCYDSKLKGSNITWIGWQSEYDDPDSDLYDFVDNWHIKLKDSLITLSDDPSTNKILSLLSDDDLDNFYNTFKFTNTDPKYSYLMRFIDWDKVKKLYGG